MFDLGWTELLLIGTVALIVVGPKDLPGMFRTVGKFVGKAKGMAREFSKAMNDAADESGVRDVTDTLRKATNPVGSAMDEVRKSATSFTQATQDAGKPKDRPDAPKAAESGLSAERQAEIDAIRKKTSETALARQSAEKAAAEAASDTTTQDGAKKPAPRKAAAPKTAKKPAPAPRKTAAAKTTNSKAASAKKPAASKPATKRASKPRTTAKGPSAKQSQTPESKA